MQQYVHTSACVCVCVCVRVCVLYLHRNKTAADCFLGYNKVDIVITGLCW